LVARGYKLMDKHKKQFKQSVLKCLEDIKRDNVQNKVVKVIGYPIKLKYFPEYIIL